MVFRFEFRKPQISKTVDAVFNEIHEFHRRKNTSHSPLSSCKVFQTKDQYKIRFLFGTQHPVKLVIQYRILTTQLTLQL